MHNEFFQILKKDHKEVMGIFEQLKSTSEKSMKNREEMFMKLKQELRPHMEAEEKVWYPLLKEKKEARENALEADEEHHAAEMVLKQLEKTAFDDETWKAKLSVLQEMVAHHVEEEEGKIFKDTEKVLKHEEIDQIMKKFEETKQKIKKGMK